MLNCSVNIKAFIVICPNLSQDECTARYQDIPSRIQYQKFISKDKQVVLSNILEILEHCPDVLYLPSISQDRHKTKFEVFSIIYLNVCINFCTL